MRPNKLYRSQKDKIIAGVCGGIAEYLNTDSTIIRILWIFASLAAGVGIIFYLIIALIIPSRPDNIETTDYVVRESKEVDNDPIDDNKE